MMKRRSEQLADGVARRVLIGHKEWRRKLQRERSTSDVNLQHRVCGVARDKLSGLFLPVDARAHQVALSCTGRT